MLVADARGIFMFITVDGRQLNTVHIIEFKNHWKKNGKEYEKAGCEVIFSNGEISVLKNHIEITNTENPIIIPAYEGFKAILYCHPDNGEDLVFYYEPIIAWKIEEWGITPITASRSWEGGNLKIPFIKEGFTNVWEGDSCWDNEDAYKESEIKKYKK